jgi:ATP-dependent Clp protease protease subunit
MNVLMDGLLSGIPESVANLQLPDPDLRNFYLDEQDRIYRLDHEVTELDLSLVNMILKCNKEDKDKPVEERKPIKVYITSPGGDVVTLWTVIQAIQHSKTPVWTINMSYAYSAAAEILVAGHKRYSMPGTQTMFHRGSAYYGGEQSTVESMKKHFDGLENKLRDFLLSHTTIDPKVYKKKASSDLYMDEHECLKNGVIDEIITDYDILF